MIILAVAFTTASTAAALAEVALPSLTDSAFITPSLPNVNIGHPKLFMVGKASVADLLAAADCE